MTLDRQRALDWRVTGEDDHRELVKDRGLPGDLGEKRVARLLRDVNLDTIRGLEDVE